MRVVRYIMSYKFIYSALIPLKAPPLAKLQTRYYLYGEYMGFGGNPWLRKGYPRFPVTDRQNTHIQTLMKSNKAELQRDSRLQPEGEEQDWLVLGFQV